MARFYEGLLTGSFKLEDGRTCRYWQVIELEMDARDGRISGTLSRTEMRKEICDESTLEENNPGTAGFEKFGACVEDVTGHVDSNGTIQLRSIRSMQIQKFLHGWDLRRYTLKTDEASSTLCGRSEAIEGKCPPEDLRVMERPSDGPSECRWKGLAEGAGQMHDGRHFRYWHLVILHWDACVGDVECSLSRMECLKEVDGCPSAREELPSYLNGWLTSFGSVVESISGTSKPDGSIALRTKNVTVTRRSSSEWRRFRYDLQIADTQSELVGKVCPIEDDYDDVSTVGVLHLFTKPMKVVSLEVVHDRFEVVCRAMSADVLATIVVDDLDESVAQFRRRLQWEVPSLLYGRVRFTLPCGSLLDDFDSARPIYEAVGMGTAAQWLRN